MSKAKIDWEAIQKEILSKTDLAAVAESWGMRFSSGSPKESGWQECHAIDREDATPSAALCVSSENGCLGLYRDLGGNGDKISFFELGARLGQYPSWRECRADLARRAGIDMPNSKGPATLTETIEEQLKILATDPSDERVRTYSGLFAMAKPGIEHSAVLAARPAFVMWMGLPVLAYFGFSPNDWENPRAVLLYRPQGDLFPAVKAQDGGGLNARKSHLLKNSRDTVIVVGGKTALDAAKVVLLTEGLPDALAAYSRLPEGYAAAATTHGAESVPADLAKWFTDKEVWIITDRDDAGAKASKLRIKSLAAEGSKASGVRAVELPFEHKKNHGKDLRDFFAEGRTFDELAALAGDSELFKPGAVDLIALAEFFSNGEEIEVETPDGTITKVEPLAMPDILLAANRLTGGYPKRVGRSDLFVNDCYGVSMLDKPAALFGWLAKFKRVKWHNKPGFVTKDEFFHELQRTAEAFSAIEELPHEPPLPGHFYTCGNVESGDGESLETLVSFFRPETTADRELIRSMFVTPAWGGRPGSRPVYAITSDQGRGAGKTKLAESVAHLWGGFVDVSPHEDIESLKSRLLSDGALLRRLCQIDNIKVGTFSWSQLEQTVTSATISGKKLYRGEGTRPNTLTWILTVNGPSLSADMAQRCIILKLVKGENQATWFESVIRHIDDNRDRIIADCLALLRAAPTAVLPRYSRWAAWEAAILSRLQDPVEVQKLILERQQACDADSDEMELVEDFFAGQLKKLGYDAERSSVRIPVDIVARWYCWATGDKGKTAGISRRLKQAADEGQLHCLKPDPSRTYGRCFVWDGVNCDQSERTQNDLKERLAKSAEAKDGKDAF